jgi:hypothetical protein
MYGTEDHHMLIRQKCMKYIITDKEYFRAFIADMDIE